jgi:hypothetical protein
MKQAAQRMLGTVVIRRMLALAFAWLVMTAASLAHAYDPALSQEEIERLERGEVVTHPDTLKQDGRRWIGGVSFAIIDAPPSEVGDVLENVDNYREILPRVRELRWIAISRAGDAIVELEQGTSLAHGRYTIGIRREREPHGAEMVRFWIDGRFRRDIADARGWFRLEPIPGDRTLISYVIMIDLGPGLFKRLFEDKIRNSALRPPLLVRRYFDNRAGR